ncbi:MAG: hypothetical protein ACPGQI_07010 [Gammaproteobacteria bacterium]
MDKLTHMSATNVHTVRIENFLVNIITCLLLLLSNLRYGIER